MGAGDVERIFMKYVIGNGGDNWESAAPGEDLHFEVLPNGNVAVRVRNVSRMRDVEALYGKAADDVVWTGEGDLQPKRGNKFNRISVFGKMGPDSIITGRDAVYPVFENRAAGAGRPMLNRGDQAYEAGHITMLRELLKKPVIANLVKGKDPKRGTPGTKAAGTVQQVLRAHRYDYGDDVSRTHNTAFDTWPKLMTFLENVNAAFEKDVSKGRLKKNPLDDLFLGNILAKEVFDGASFDKWSAKRYNNVALERLPGESDEDFYNRHLAEVNEYRRHGVPSDEYRGKEMTLDQYYNWIIDNMVHNLYVVSKTLEGRDEELREVAKNKLRMLKTSSEADDSEWWEMSKSDIYALHGFKARAKYLERNKKDVEGAIARIQERASKKSWSERVAVAQSRLDAANKMLEQMAEKASSLKNKDAGERLLGKAKAMRDAFADTASMLAAGQEAAGQEAAGQEAAGQEASYASGDIDTLLFERAELEKQLEAAIVSVASQYKARLEEKGLSDQEVRYRVHVFLEEERYKEKSKKCKELVSKISAIDRQAASLAVSERQAVRDSFNKRGAPASSKNESVGNRDEVTGQLLDWMTKYKEKQERKLQRVREDIARLEEVKARYDAAKDNRSSRIGELDRLNSSAGVWLFQMGAKESDMATLGNVLGTDRDSSAVPFTSSNARLVSMGILLGKTGMRLEQVKEACKGYYRLRARGAKGVDAFFEMFDADPFNIPSDERIKDFHGSWKRAKDNEACRARIIEAVDRRFF